MTVKPFTSQKVRPTPRRAVLPFFLLLVLLLAMILRNAQIAADYMKVGLRLCARTVIPSLFPFMVISELLVRCGVGTVPSRFGGTLFSALFGLPSAASAPLLLGGLCGFPVGAKTALSLYDQGQLSRVETERVLAFCNIPSSGFLIGAVGVSLYGSRRFGCFLFFTALFISLFCGLIMRLCFPLPQSRSTATDTGRILPPIGFSTFTQAVSEATASMLSVCACVVFFTSVVGCLSHLLSACSVPPFFRALLFGLCEISSGVNTAATLSNIALGAALCGFSVGWSGLSVHLQILSLGSDRGISPTPYLVSKLMQGILCGLAAFCYATFSDPPLSPSPQSAAALMPSEGALVYVLGVGLLFLLGLSLRYRRLRASRRPLDKTRPI